MSCGCADVQPSRLSRANGIGGSFCRELSAGKSDGTVHIPTGKDQTGDKYVPEEIPCAQSALTPLPHILGIAAFCGSFLNCVHSRRNAGLRLAGERLALRINIWPKYDASIFFQAIPNHHVFCYRVLRSSPVVMLIFCLKLYFGKDDARKRGQQPSFDPQVQNPSPNVTLSLA